VARKRPQTEKTLINDIVDALEKKLGKSTRSVKRPLLPAVVKAILAVDSTEKKVDAAYARIEEEYVDWNEVRVTLSRDLAKCIRGVGDEPAKAVALKAVLSKVFGDRHELYLDFLADMQNETLIAYLESIQDMSRLYQQAILVRALGHGALLIGTGALRVLKRVGVVPRQIKADEAFEVLSGVVPKRRLLSFSVLIAQAASDYCSLREPVCRECPIRVLCVEARTSSRSRKKKKA